MIWRSMLVLLLVGCIVGIVLAYRNDNMSAAIGWAVALLGWETVWTRGKGV